MSLWAEEPFGPPPTLGERLLVQQIAALRPKVHCLMNTVAQPITANLLLAVGAVPSMSMHPAEMADMAGSADALVINLGTLDETREQAIETLIGLKERIRVPVVLDPVFVERSALRLRIARQVAAAFPRLIVKGNAAEMGALAGQLPEMAVQVTTGDVDRVAAGSRVTSINGGDPMLARVTGAGCALGALIAAAAVADRDGDLFRAAFAITQIYNRAGVRAAAYCRGPGSFAAFLPDELHRLTRDEGQERMA